mmetsp:Transcript_2309/g.3666  ORF Transcript_2309/g.3666 Transcript_2309/m.3666 type:complete len:100 (-) Transcript_2309:402-701(-)
MFHASYPPYRNMHRQHLDQLLLPSQILVASQISQIITRTTKIPSADMVFYIIATMTTMNAARLPENATPGKEALASSTSTEYPNSTFTEKLLSPSSPTS